jgi:hypothetical protein
MLRRNGANVRIAVWASFRHKSTTYISVLTPELTPENALVYLVKTSEDLKSLLIEHLPKTKEKQYTGRNLRRSPRTSQK